MRQEHETATSFNQLKEITQAIMLKKDAPTNATNQDSTNAKAHTSEPTQEKGAKPKASAQTKKGALNPTKKAFSERQITAFRDNSQDSAKALKQGLKTPKAKGGKNES
ncbi:hypothetical protein ACLGEH_03970 [Helicobacter pylori]